MADKNNNNIDFSINRNYKGLVQDTNPIDQPEGTYLFALNAVIENETGDSNLLSNELSNKAKVNLPEDFVVIGTCYIGDNETCVFLVSKDDSVSMIGVIDANDNWDASRVISDIDSIGDAKLNFRRDYPIKSTYRLRLGCEKTVYWTDKLNKPRYYNFNKPEEFKINSKLHSNKFNIQSNYNSIPKIELSVEDVGGNLAAGSYRVAVQYVDSNNNTTEWVTVSSQIIIYNASIHSNFNDIWGNISFKEGGDDYHKSTKSIKVVCENLDMNYPYIRYGFIEYTNSSGQISDVKISPKIPTKQSVFIYTGDNAETQGTVEEITQYNNVIETVGEITQIDNKLIFGNIQNSTVDYCQFQKYASLITADCVTKEIDIDVLNPDDKSNPKHPLHNTGYISYFPGEIYSFGIKYYLDDGSSTPVYHIPGRSPNDDKDIIYSPGNGVKPMSNNNQLDSITYIDRTACNANENYWGVDNTNRKLAGSNVRHHRFPTRKELGIPLFKIESSGGTTQSERYYYSIQLSGLTPSDQEGIDKYVETKLAEKIVAWKKENCVEAEDPCEPSQELIDAWTQEILNSDDIKNILLETKVFELVYTLDGETKIKEFTYNSSDIVFHNNTLNINLDSFSEEKTIEYVDVQIAHDDNITDEEKQIILQKYFGNLTTEVQSSKTINETILPDKHKTTILGIKFSNIIKPELIGNRKVIGYKIVRNERTDTEKTILDSAVLIPTIKYNRYISCGLLAPDTDGYGEARDCWGMVHLEHKFLHKQYKSFSSLTQEGSFAIVSQKYGLLHENNVLGDALDIDEATGGEELDRPDDDGWSLAIGTRDSKVKYSVNYSGFTIKNSDVKQIEYLRPLESCRIRDNNNDQYDFFNAAADTPIAVLQLNRELTKDEIPERTLPYVYIKSDKKTSYTNFQTLPYYDEHSEIKEFGNENVVFTEIFNGDSNISAVKYIHSIFLQNEVAFRTLKPKKKKSILGWIGLAILGLAALAASIFVPGLSTAVAVGIASVGAGLTGSGIALALGSHSANIKRELLEEAFTKHYNRGLRGTIYDNWVGNLFGRLDLFKKSIFYSKDSDNILDDTEFLNNFAKNKNPRIMSFNYKLQLNSYLQQMGFSLDKGDYDNSIIGHSIAPALNSVSPTSYWDDTIIWVVDAISDLWFESTINGFLRIQLPSYSTDFIPAPSIVQDGNISPIRMLRSNVSNASDEQRGFNSLTPFFSDLVFTADEIRPAVSELERYAYKKFLISIESSSADNPTQEVAYIGAPSGEYYGANFDYFPIANIKRSYLLSQDYDCCSECKEKFPHRLMWSESSFDEEQSDNFRVFKANNYKDLPGNTGEITNIVTYNNQLLIHTEEALYIQPRNIQERITDEIISFIGTGEYGSLPAQRIVNDDTGMSAGLQHRFGAMKFQYGYMFVSERERKVYLFDKQLNPISETGMSKWFHKNLPILLDNSWIKEMNDTYNLSDNPFNELGTGYTLGYDSRFVRALLTKHDGKIYFDKLKELIGSNDIFLNNGYLFANYNEQFMNLQNQGYVFEKFGYRKLDNGERVYSAIFSKHEYDSKTITITIEESVFKDIDYLVFYYDFTNSEGRRDLDTHTQLVHPYTSRDLGWSRSPSDPKGHIKWCGDNTGNGLESILIDVKKLKADYPNLEKIEFDTGAFWFKGAYTTDGPVYLKAVPYKGGEMYLENFEFKNRGGERLLEDGYIFGSKFIDIKGGGGTTNYIGKATLNLINGELLMNGESYGDIPVDTIIKETTKETVDINLKHKYIDGTKISDEVMSEVFKEVGSFTISYSFKNKSWTSFHSYIPNHYFAKPNNLYTVLDDNSGIVWKHNEDYSHQEFYGNKYKFIVEYIDNKNPLITKIWNHIQFNTEAQVYDKDLNIYHEDKYSTFQTAVLYNSRQSSGIMILVPKDKELDKDYISKQIKEATFAYIDKHEGNWYLNDFRDLQKDPKVSSWNKDLNVIQVNEFIDKVINQSNIDIDKDWTQQEKFRDKYLVIRLEFDNFVDNKDIKLVSEINVHNQQRSER